MRLPSLLPPEGVVRVTRRGLFPSRGGHFFYQFHAKVRSASLLAPFARSNEPDLIAKPWKRVLKG